MVDEPGHQITVDVGESDSGARLDVFIARAIEDLSRSRAKALILSGMVSIDSAISDEPKRPVRTGESVSITRPRPSPAIPTGEAIPLDIVHEDDDLIVVNKPPGMVVHPAPGHTSGTLVNALIHHCRDSLSGIGGVARPGIVHRLDKDTSGLMVVAKTDRAHAGLSSQFADHGRSGPLERAYLALCWGVPSRPKGAIDAPLGRAANNREKIEVKRRGGREAITHYTVTDRFEVTKGTAIASLLSCRLETGRTHQIRVHLAAIGHPVIGDPAYGAGFATKALLLPEPPRSRVASFPRQALHASLLGFEHPTTRQALRFERPPPEDMQALIAALKSL
ncbi:MAG: RluA family pseudouridine synthase [Hyphomicrobiales bacterium]|nr:RluA family pseudouridine synthase [Hyphomicrobiales bacterium]